MLFATLMSLHLIGRKYIAISCPNNSVRSCTHCILEYSHRSITIERNSQNVINSYNQLAERSLSGEESYKVNHGIILRNLSYIVQRCTIENSLLVEHQASDLDALSSRRVLGCLRVHKCGMRRASRQTIHTLWQSLPSRIEALDKHCLIRFEEVSTGLITSNLDWGWYSRVMSFT